MSQYSELTKQRLFSYPIVSVLASFGRRTDRPGNHGNFFSPFRDEKNPSFSIDQVKNTWYDHGLGIGGGVVALVGMLRSCSRSEALDYLASLDPSVMPVPDSTPARESRLIVDSHGEIESRVLLSYGEKFRGIPRDILRQYCEEVHYHFTGLTTGSFFSIGFLNNGGGWTLRNSRSKNCSSPADITTIDIWGERSVRAATDRVTLFEGFFDFLSWLVYRGETYPDTDICVLNSVSFAARSLDYLRSHDEVFLCLDNDVGGRKAAELVSSSCPGVLVKDCSGVYGDFNDFNEFLLHHPGGCQESR